MGSSTQDADTIDRKSRDLPGKTHHRHGQQATYKGKGQAGNTAAKHSAENAPGNQDGKGCLGTHQVQGHERHDVGKTQFYTRKGHQHLQGDKALRIGKGHGKGNQDRAEGQSFCLTHTLTPLQSPHRMPH